MRLASRGWTLPGSFPPLAKLGLLTNNHPRQAQALGQTLAGPQKTPFVAVAPRWHSREEIRWLQQLLHYLFDRPRHQDGERSKRPWYWCCLRIAAVAPGPGPAAAAAVAVVLVGVELFLLQAAPVALESGAEADTWRHHFVQIAAAAAAVAEL